MRLRITMLATALVLSGSACGHVKPWEREALARSDMAWDPDELEATFRNHVFFSKEASLAGGGAGGGGCGCN
jgi:hypothetical protein